MSETVTLFDESRAAVMTDSLGHHLLHLGACHDVRFFCMIDSEGWTLSAWSHPNKIGSQSLIAQTTRPALVDAVWAMRAALQERGEGKS